MARMSDKVESTCTARGDSAELIIRFFQLDPTLEQEVIFGVHHGYIASTQNIMKWTPASKELSIGPHWNLWKTGSTEQVEGPELSFQINAPSTIKQNSRLWEQLVQNLKASKASDFNAQVNKTMHVIAAKKYKISDEPLKSNRFFTLTLYSNKIEDSERYGGDKFGNFISLACGSWEKRKN